MKPAANLSILVSRLGSRVARCFFLTICFLGPFGEGIAFQGNRQQGVVVCSSSESINWSDHEGTTAGLSQLYVREAFEQLETSLDCLINEGRRFVSGRPGSSAIYAFYKMVLPAPGADPAEVSRIERWAKFSPKSIYVRFAQARFAYAMAWNRRGGSVAKDVNEESWKGFREGLKQTEEILLRSSEELHNTPIYYHLLLAISQDSNQLPEARLAVFQAGIARWPTYYGLYENMLKRLVPKWGGSWVMVDQAIRTWSAERSEAEGVSLYSRFYARVLLDGASVEETLINWPTMKTSLEDLVRRYPDNYNWSLAASSACLFGDNTFYKFAMGNLAPTQVQSTAWFKSTNPDTCSRLLR